MQAKRNLEGEKEEAGVATLLPLGNRLLRSFRKSLACYARRGLPEGERTPREASPFGCIPSGSRSEGSEYAGRSVRGVSPPPRRGAEEEKERE